MDLLRLLAFSSSFSWDIYLDLSPAWPAAIFSLDFISGHIIPLEGLQPPLGLRSILPV